MIRRFIFALALACAAITTVSIAAPFELKEGDRVVFLGDTFIEREQRYGWIELVLTTRFPDRNITFRNIGWSADTPSGRSRLGLSLRQAGLEPQGEGWEILQKQIAETKPTVAFIGYGMASSFDGEAGLTKFEASYNRLLNTLEQLSPGVRFVLLTPIKHEKLPPPMPDPEKHNEQLARYAKVIEQVATERGLVYINLFDEMLSKLGRGSLTKPLTENGIHLDGGGYQFASREILQSLFPSDTFEFPLGPVSETMRQVIVRKNEFYFHRSRPANMAYIFGFRKREQGQNAVEMPQFDPLIEAEEKKIRELCKLLDQPGLMPDPQLHPAVLRSQAAAAVHTPQPHPEFTVADGLEVTLWAENPHLAKPIQINFDPQGRLWVASSEIYPQIEPGQAAHDKVIVLEDTTGAGKADKATVFADDLLIPTGVIPGDGGCYVAQSTKLLHLKDTDGDGKADVRRIALTSFGTEDTHHNLHTLCWGPDGRLWMNQSIYTRSEIETPHGVVRLHSGGVFRFEPSSQKLEIVFKGWVNAWGHEFDAFGQSFLTDGAGFMGINWGMPGAMYFTYAKARRTMPSVSPGNYPKFASIEIIRSTHFPADWQGRVVTCDFRANRVTSFDVSESGAGYETRQGPDLLRTANNTFRPIDVKLGPDGALYIADWSNPIINHGEVDFRDPRRDREHGRIWRVSVKGRAALKKPGLAQAGMTALLNELLSANHFNAAQATRVLVEKGAAVVAPELTNWTAQLKNEKDLLAALWIHQALNLPAPGLLDRVLAAQDGRIRAAGVRVLSHAGALPAAPVRVADTNGTVSTHLTDGGASFSVGDTVARLARLVADPHPRVRMEAVRALVKFPSAEAAASVLAAVNTIGSDPFLDYAVWLSINDLAEPFLVSLESGAWQPDSPAKQRQLEFAMKALEPAVAASSVAKILTVKPLTRDGAGPWIELIGAAGGQEEVNRLWEQVGARDFTDEALNRALAALASAARLRSVKPAGDASLGVPLLSHASLPIRLGFVNLLGAWKNPGAAFADMVKLAGSAGTPDAVRTALFAAFRELGAIPPVVGALQPLAAKTSPAPVRRAAAITLASLQPGKFADLALDELAGTKTEAEALELWRSVLATKGASKQFADKVAARSALPAHVAVAGLRTAREGSTPDPAFIAALTKLLNITALSPDKLTPEKLKELADIALKAGDPARGERVYRRTELGCTLCHGIGGVGGKVGPDMTSLGAAAPADYLVESLLLPSAKIKEGFHGVTIETKDDLEYNGILVRETGQEIVLRNAQNQEVSVAVANVRKRSNAQTSLMPAGLLDTLPESDRNDLVAFLSRLGRPGEFDASKGGVVRVWRVLPVTHRMDQGGWEKITKGDFTAKWTAMESGIGNITWTTLASLVNGSLTKSEFAALTDMPKSVTLTSLFVGTTFSLAKAGPVTLNVEGIAKPEIWIDGQRLSKLGNNFSAGTHTLILRLDGAQLPEKVRVKSAEASWSLN
ncbi:MAG: PVC-type heme-binding CxxCH protein [Limisphaerales bacterium]